MNQSRYPLEGIRVLEFTTMVAGPCVGKLLADYGAQVIVVENRERLLTRFTGRNPSMMSTDQSNLNRGEIFNKFNGSKLSLTLNMQKNQAKDIVERLVAISDVVLDNLAPRVLESWGLDYPGLVRIKPDIIQLRMAAEAFYGPHKGFRTVSWGTMGMAGLNYASSIPGRPPICASRWSHPDVGSNPFHAGTAVLAALYYRAKTGRGQLIELSQYESALCFTGTTIFDYLVNRRLPKPMGNSSDCAAPHGVYSCRGHDRWCAIAVFTEEEWEAFCRTIGREDMMGDDRFSTFLNRLKHNEELDHIINEWTAERVPEEVMRLMQGAGIAAGVVQNVEDLLVKDPQLKERNFWMQADHPEAGKVVTDSWAFRLSRSVTRMGERAPLLGEHNDFVLGEILGIQEDDINQLIIDGVVD